jgi:hypothetical protein
MTKYILPTDAPGITPPKRPDDLSRKTFGARTGFNTGLNDYQAKLSPTDKPSGSKAGK